MSQEDTRSEFKNQCASLIDTLISITGRGSLKWVVSNYSPRDLDPSARILESYSAEAQSTTFYVYKRAAFSPQRGTTLENVFEFITKPSQAPTRAPYIPTVDELILIAAKNAIQSQSNDISRITEDLSRA